MFVLDVIPISRGISREMLSYFSATAIEPGRLLKAPLRSGSARAIVVSCRSATEAKSEIRSLEFGLRKIEDPKTKQFLSRPFIEAAVLAGRYCAASTGSVLASLIPQAIIASEEEKSSAVTTEEPKNTVNGSYETLIIQAPDIERRARYKALVREEFARKRSIIVCLPSIHDIEPTLASLPKGIEDYTFILHGSLSKKELAATWQKIPTVNHPVLIIGTLAALAISRTDIGTIVIEREQASGWKLPARPFLDVRYFAETLARKLGAKLVLGDIMLRAETVWRFENHEVSELLPLSFRSVSRSRQTIIDMKRPANPGDPNEKAEFKILSDELTAIIGSLPESGKRMFLFGSRRGLAAMTVCADCGTVVACENCSAPIVLHTSSAGNLFLCHKCGERRPADLTCVRCGGWRLTPLGIGIERIEEELTRQFPDVPVFRIDRDSATTRKKGIAIIEKFHKTPGSILLGTELGLLYLNHPVEHSAVVSLDSLFSLPDFKINERVMSILIRIRAASTGSCTIQTRRIDQPLWRYVETGLLADFYRNELEERKRYEYPPFWQFIKISASGEKSRVVKEMKALEEKLKPHTLHLFPAFIERIKGKYLMHGVIKLPRGEWINEQLLNALLLLPPYVAINVDPESLL